MPLRRGTIRPRSLVSSRSQARKRVWADFDLTYSILAVPGTIQSDMLAPYRAAAGYTPEGITVVRIVGWHACSNDGTVVKSGIRRGTFREDPDDMDPIAFNFQDWMYLQVNQSLVATDRAGGPAFERFDLRGKRKLDEIDTTLWWATSAITVGAPSAAGRVHARVLLLLP